MRTEVKEKFWRRLFEGSDRTDLVISLSRTSRSLRKLIVGFYRSGGRCEEILVPVKIAFGNNKYKNHCYISNNPDRRKDPCPSPTSFQSTSENLGFLYWESSKEEWLLGWASFDAPTLKK